MNTGKIVRKANNHKKTSTHSNLIKCQSWSFAWKEKKHLNKVVKKEIVPKEVQRYTTYEKDGPQKQCK